MAPKNQGIRVGILLASVLVLLVSSCAAIQDVRVHYRVPAPSGELAGKTVFIDFEDQRENPAILGAGARKAFTYSSGNVDLTISQDGAGMVTTGSRDIPSLFREVFTQRIQALGGKVVTRRAEADAQLVLVLETFSLDLRDRTWIARMNCEARAIRGEEARANQWVTGEAERVKILGLKQADQVMDDLFTDTVNRLDIPDLLQRAGL